MTNLLTLKTQKSPSGAENENKNMKDESGLKEPLIGNSYKKEEASLLHNSLINIGQEDQMEVYGYRSHMVLTIASWFFTVLTLGVIRLIFHWWPEIVLFTTHYQCPLSIAEKLLLVEHPKKSYSCYHVKTVKTLSSQTTLEEIKQLIDDISSSNTFNNLIGISDLPFIRTFELKKQRYIWVGKAQCFLKLEGLDSNVSTAFLHEQTGVSPGERKLRILLYGRNLIAVPMQGITKLLFLEVLNPFYIFQVFSFGLWYAYEYVCYAVAILMMSAFSVIMTVIQTRDNQQKLFGTIHSSDVVSVLQLSTGSKEPVVSTIPSEQLVPGDLMLVPTHGCIMHCDAVLLMGNCIVNESMLTGESLPVTKTPLINSHKILYDTKEHAKHTLFCGTRVIKTRSQNDRDIYAVVIRTGFSTAKGELVRSILYPTPITFKFEQDSYKFIQFMACLASFGFFYTVITKLKRGVSATTVALEALDLVTVIVPPALPAAMTVGCMSAQSRLRKQNIYCVSPRMINMSGSINCMCFDKTGTLTQDELDMWGVASSVENSLSAPVNNVNTLEQDKLLYAMATCHSLSVIDGKICGDPLDIKMFEWTKWILEELDDGISSSSYKKPTQMIVRSSKNSIKKHHQEIEIICQFPFSSHLQRMTVVTRQVGASDFTVYSKGSPEIIQNLCNPNSIPINFERKLQDYTEKGLRVLGIAYKLGDSDSINLPREKIEKDLNFLGLVIFENKLKPLTAGVIGALQAANIRPIMVTGDNELTALSVAKECGIISSSQKVFIVNVPPTTADCTKPRLVLRPWDIDNFHSETHKTLEDETKCATESENVDEGNDTSEGNTNSGHCDILTNPNVSLALTGAVWELIHSSLPDKVPTVVNRGIVFSRMSPDHKQQLVLTLQSLGYYVGMCGDGANDCGALKAAHAGISLSEAESSIASPFTSRESNIDCVIKVIQEGRAALVTSFAIFKYMAGYSLTQFFSVMILYSIDSNLTDIQYLFVDLFIISVFSFVLGHTGANYGPLVARPPAVSLMNPTVIASLIGQVAIVAVFQFISFFSLSNYEWFEPYDSSKAASKGPGCLENYALFAMSSMQYVILAVVFCKGAPYRMPVSKNWSLWAAVAGIALFISYLILSPNQWFQDLFELVMPPELNFRVFCIVLCAANFILAVIFDFFICDNLIFSKLRSTGTHVVEKEKTD